MLLTCVLLLLLLLLLLLQLLLLLLRLPLPPPAPPPPPPLKSTVREPSKDAKPLEVPFTVKNSLDVTVGSIWTGGAVGETETLTTRPYDGC
eukprot:6207507-Pyramimonas_sp.AAC.1